MGWFAWLGGLGMLVMLRVVWGGGPAELVCLAGRVRQLWRVWLAGRVVRLVCPAVVQGLLEPAERVCLAGRVRRR